MGGAPKVPCLCSLTAQGTVEAYAKTINKSIFDCGKVTITPDICVYCGEVPDSSLLYSVIDESGKNILKLYALPESIKIICPNPFNCSPSPKNTNRIIIGGRVIITSKNKITEEFKKDKGTFILFVYDNGKSSFKDIFRIIIQADKEHSLDYETHLTRISSGDLIVGNCCDL